MLASHSWNSFMCAQIEAIFHHTEYTYARNSNRTLCMWFTLWNVIKSFYFIGCISAGLLVHYKIYDLQRKMWQAKKFRIKSYILNRMNMPVNRLSFSTINDVTCHCQFVEFRCQISTFPFYNNNIEKSVLNLICHFWDWWCEPQW